LIRFSKYLDENKIEEEPEKIGKGTKWEVIDHLDEKIDRVKLQLEEAKRKFEHKEKQVNKKKIYEEVLNHIIK